MRKAKLLKGAGIHISEDFSRKVRNSLQYTMLDCKSLSHRRSPGERAQTGAQQVHEGDKGKRPGQKNGLEVKNIHRMYCDWQSMHYRYDKLYMGNDVFFFNDKSGRVERLHALMEGPSVYNRSGPDQTQILFS